ncbi:MAG: hypothetical protein WCK03_00690, partial [Candidatus Taylorbacteria bacterium]
VDFQSYIVSTELNKTCFWPRRTLLGDLQAQEQALFPADLNTKKKARFQCFYGYKLSCLFDFKT